MRYEMRKACIVVNDYYKKNRLFDLDDSFVNRDNWLFGFHLLKTEFRRQGIDLSTHDINSIRESEIVIFNDMPETSPAKAPGQVFFLLALESIAVLPANFNLYRYDLFDKIFTWKDDIIDGAKVIKINYSFQFDYHFSLDLGDKEKLCCMIVNNKYSCHENELYSARIEAIKWFEKHHPDEFDLYGSGWDQYFSDRFLNKVIRRARLGSLIKRRRYQCYRGTVPSKVPTLKKYRFTLCYENVRDIPGYITEKIFDCFFAGSVPIYLGAGNITEHIPLGCFIDKREYATYDEMYRYLTGMTDATYISYLENIRAFLDSPASYEFTADNFVHKIIGEINAG